MYAFSESIPVPGEKCQICEKTCPLYGDPKLYIEIEVARIKKEARKNPLIGTNSFLKSQVIACKKSVV